MVIKIGINGFGRIGRLAFRAAHSRTDVEVVAVNDPFMTSEYVAYQLRYDSVHGQFNLPVSVDANDNLKVHDKTVRLFHEKEPNQIAWNSVGVDVVLECTGVFTSKEKAIKHAENGSLKVVISAPPKDNVPMYVVGVNHHEYKGEKIISNASCTTNCLAPMAKILDDKFGIAEGLMTTIHACTANQMTVDGPSKGGKDWRAGRAASVNIIPASTGAAVAVTKVLPKLQNKLTGMAFRVPVVDVSCVDLTVKLNKSTTLANIIEEFTNAAKSGPLHGILGVTNQEVVSSDFVHDSRSCIVDAGACMQLNDTFFKIVGWYDNEWGYATRLIDLCGHIGTS